MKLPTLASVTLALSLVSSLALAQATVSGPIGDRQLVRGKKLGMSWGAAPNVTVTAAAVNYGFHGTTTATATLSETGYGNRAAILDVPADAAGFWYTILVSSPVPGGYTSQITQSNNGQPFAIPVSDRAVSVTKAYPGSGTMVVKYSGAVTTTYDTYLHLGWNNWNAVGDAFMTRTDFSYFKAGVYYDYNSVNIDAPWWANYLDFVVKDARNGGTWDTNGGAGWHDSLHPFTSSNVYTGGSTTTTVTITYADGGLSPVVVHYGTDGWNNVADAAMQSVSGGYQVSLQVPPGAQTLEYAFTDGNGHWENNFGMNWSVALH